MGNTHQRASTAGVLFDSIVKTKRRLSLVMSEPKRSRFDAEPPPPPASLLPFAPAPFEELAHAVLSRATLALWANSPLFGSFVTGGYVWVSGRHISPRFEPDMLLCKVLRPAPPASVEYDVPTPDGKGVAVRTRAKIVLSFLRPRATAPEEVPIRIDIVSNQAPTAAEYARLCAGAPQLMLSPRDLYGLLDTRDRLAAAVSRRKCSKVVVGSDPPVHWGQAGTSRLLLRSWTTGVVALAVAVAVAVGVVVSVCVCVGGCVCEVVCSQLFTVLLSSCVALFPS